MAKKRGRITEQEIEYFRHQYKMGGKNDVEEIDIFCDQVLDLIKEADRD